MALVLAVEPDQRQAANLTKVLQARPRTELVIADSAARALQSLASRVPDVLLTSPLLSRQDEAALAGWLRELGPAGAHVQELTIPILAAAATGPTKKRGVLATLRREQSDAKPGGCEPDMFAEQISVYAERATAGRKYEPPPPVDLLLLPPADGETPTPEADMSCDMPPRDEWTRALVFDEAAPPQLPADEGTERWSLLLRTQTEHELAVLAVLAMAPLPATVVFSDDLTLRLDFEAVAQEPIKEDEAPWIPVELDAPLTPPRSRPAMPAVKPKKAVRPQGKPAKPLQDEWGLFDPAQCGFAALLEKLDEITEQQDGHKTTAPTTVRVLAY